MKLSITVRFFSQFKITILIVLSIFLLNCTVENEVVGTNPFGSENPNQETTLSIEKIGDGNGNIVTTDTLFLGHSTTLYAIERDHNGNFLKNLEVSWVSHGGIGTLTVDPFGRSAVFNSTAVGTGFIKAVINGKEARVDITVVDTVIPFNITGITSTSGDVTTDNLLTNGVNPVVEWEVTQGETGFSIEILNDNDTQKCAPVLASIDATSLELTGCSLDQGKIYKANVVGLNSEGDVAATNNGFSFSVYPGITVDDITHAETEATADFTVTLSDTSDFEVTVDWATADNTAISVAPHDDFQSALGSLTFAVGETAKNVSITLTNDPYDEDNQTFHLDLSNASMARIDDAQGEATLTDEDLAPTISIDADASATEGGSVSFEITRTQRSEKNITFNFSTANGSPLSAITPGDYTNKTNEANIITAGTDLTTPYYVTVDTTDDATICEDPETFVVAISSLGNALGGTLARIATINENDLPEISVANDTEIEGTNLVFNVTLDYSCPGKTVSFDWATFPNTATSNVDYNYNSGTINIAHPGLADTITVTTINDNVPELLEESMFIYSSNHSNSLLTSNSNAVGKIQDNDGSTGVAKVALGSNYSCALSNAGDVKCWGYDEYGVLGQTGFHWGDEAGEIAALPYVDLGAGVLVDKVAVGSAHGCALTTSGQMKCWGSNDNGQLGYEDEEERGDNLGEMGNDLAFVDLGTVDGLKGNADFTAVKVMDIGVGSGITCAIVIDPVDEPSFSTDGGYLKCWGGDWRGFGYENTATLGDDPGEMGDNLPPINLGTENQLGVTALKAKSVIIGEYRICAITSEDGLKCWGAGNGDEPGEMGDNQAYIDFGSSFDVAEVSRGFYAWCARSTTGLVKCWNGSNNSGGHHGQEDTILRDSYNAAVMGDNLPPIDFGTGRTAKRITSGYYHNCAILDNDKVKCWGENNYGQLGYGDNQDRGDDPGEMGDGGDPGDGDDNLPYVDLGTGRTAKDIAAMAYGNCVILDDDSIKCWGSNQKGSIGSDSTSALGNGAGEMGDALLPLALGENALSLAQGAWNDGGGNRGHYKCAVMASQQVKCWGSNHNSRLPLVDKNFGDEAGEMGVNLDPIDLGTGITAVDISVGTNNACAILNTGDAKCWGYNPEDQLGSGGHKADNPNEMGDSQTPMDLGTKKALKIFMQSWRSSCAIMDDFSTKCWGDNLSGALGRSDGGGDLDPDDEVFLDFGAGLFATKIVSGWAGACALLNNNEVKCWGTTAKRMGYEGVIGVVSDEAGEMGDNLPAVDLGSTSYPVDIAGSSDHVCALFANGGVKCWGENGSGELGQNSTTDLGDNVGEMGDNLNFINFGANTYNVNSIFSGISANANCATFNDGSLRCWGNGSSGRLGLGNTDNWGDNEDLSLLPAADLNGDTAVDGGIGSGHTCVILDDGQLKCFGRNKHGQLGLGDDDDRGDTGGEMAILPYVDLNF